METEYTFQGMINIVTCICNFHTNLIFPHLKFANLNMHDRNQIPGSTTAFFSINRSAQL